jgi:uncharacterized membrane protein
MPVPAPSVTVIVAVVVVAGGFGFGGCVAGCLGGVETCAWTRANVSNKVVSMGDIVLLLPLPPNIAVQSLHLSGLGRRAVNRDTPDGTYH